MACACAFAVEPGPVPSPSPAPAPAPEKAAPTPAPAPPAKPDPVALERQRAILGLNAQIGAAYAEADAASKAGDKPKAEGAMARFRDLDAKQNRLIYDDFKTTYLAKLKGGAAVDATTPNLNQLIEVEKAVAVLKDEQSKSATDGSSAEKKAKLADDLATLEKDRAQLEVESIYEAVYSVTITGVTRRFPELKNPQSEFSKRMDARIDELNANKDPLLDNPKHPLMLAQEIAQDLAKKREKK
jgi:hypothetical protein